MQTEKKHLARFVRTIELLLHARCFPSVCMTCFFDFLHKRPDQQVNDLNADERYHYPP